jgi:gag-polyprotein putative aspartyl protease
MDGCLILTDYFRRGLCKASDSGYVVLPNGDRFNAPGKDIKERIDNWYKENTKPAQSVSTTFVGTSSFNPMSEFVWTNAEEESDPVTERELEDMRTRECMIASSQKKVDATKQRMNGQNKGNGNARASTRVEKTAPLNDKVEPVKPTAEPQFRYITPIEDPSLIKTVIKQALDVPLTISTCELLSLAPDIRKQVKDLLTTKRVSQNATTAFIGDDTITEDADVFLTELANRSSELVVAREVEELRALEVKINGIAVEALADDGSQIISIRKDIWERIGTPIRSDHVMMMESANKSKNETMGLLQDLKVEIGGYDFYVQAQVVQDAPYELLLGRPFFTLTQANHKHFSNGSSHITLVDPNSEAVITIPTHARIREKTQLIVQTGF